jgi:hypothetical protein
MTGAMRYAHDANFDPSSRFYGKIKVDGIGMVGYSLGGGRVVEALTAIEARAAERRAAAASEAERGFTTEKQQEAAFEAAFASRTSSTQRALLGGSESANQRCVGSCEATLCSAAVSLQGWGEGPGSDTSTPMMILTADTDTVAGPW